MGQSGRCNKISIGLTHHCGTILGQHNMHWQMAIDTRGLCNQEGCIIYLVLVLFLQSYKQMLVAVCLLKGIEFSCYTLLGNQFKYMHQIIYHPGKMSSVLMWLCRLCVATRSIINPNFSLINCLFIYEADLHSLIIEKE